ncbi:uncharacterized protein BJ171DRAFT_112740 [Polychytrium aggregatum]|uniref:uncharacterized protein n=1 Tax=Polychytrium aggregatum TaxID=110093 RepID=UPI0022FEA748|nr:uncharacterized protein BJ171DRAFT_112740 [Polychytrium aggregatum]KAI9209294.1 hypothetical protein BJ171DRAFT_112740 [Polychytrium aggregatum]
MDGGGYLRSLYSSVESQGMLFVLIWHSLSDASKAQILWILRLLVRTLFQKFLQRMLPGGDGAPGSRRQRLSGDREGDSHPAHPRGRHNGKLLPLHAPTSPSESNSPRNPRKTPLSVRFANAPDQSSIVDTHPTLVASQGLHKTPSPKHDLRRVLPAPQPNVSILRKDPSMPQSRSYNDLLPIFRHQAGRYPPHTFSSPLQDALKALVDVEASADWVPRSSSNGIRISVRESPNRKDGMPLVRGDGVISGDWGIEEVASAISSYQARAEWDKRFDSGSILCQYNPFESLAYLTQKGTFPVAGRDFLVVSATRIDAASQSAYIVSTSVDPSQLSEIEQAIYTPYHQKSKDSGFVRADLKLNGWILRRRDDGVAATYILDVDVKGSIPQSILRMIQTQSPMCILGISQYLGSHGPLPFLLRSHDALLPHRPVQLKKVSQSPRQIDAMVEAALAPSSPRESAPDAPENPKVSHGRLEGLVADSLVLCIPKSSHPGLDITIEPAQGIRIFRLASDPALAGVLSPHATHLLQIHPRTGSESTSTVPSEK